MLRLGDFLSRRGDPLQIEALTGDLGLDRPMTAAEVAGPGLALAGYTGRFAANEPASRDGAVQVTPPSPAKRADRNQTGALVPGDVPGCPKS